MNSQASIVLTRLEHGEKLSSRDAVVNYGIQDLPKRISDLRKAGYRINGERVTGKNRHGGNTHWNIYWLEGENESDTN